MSKVSTALCLTLVLPASALAVDYIGSQRCAKCHQTQLQEWVNSHHDLAIAEPETTSVRGNFSGTNFNAHGVTSSFRHQGDQFVIRTDGVDGILQDFPVRYTFGVYPLQQYLLELPGGRLQASSVAWDSRTQIQGGQRWYHLYAETTDMNHQHPLHWTSPEQNWNYQCADCHSTGLQKNFDPVSGQFDTRWQEIDVACEACHGPGAEHLKWVETLDSKATNKGLSVHLPSYNPKKWKFNASAGIPQQTTGSDKQTEVDVCARCHSRRSRIWSEDNPGVPLLDTHLPALLHEDLYFADGQIRDEVYEYGSFAQSRMYAAGVTCSDCHNPHSLQLRAQGNHLCNRCHDSNRYDQSSHHHHIKNNAGALCTACHMPQRTYMGVDERADHSLRIPRPDLTVDLGSPNACNGCHDEQSAEWAQAKLTQWFPDSLYRGMHFGHVLHAARAGEQDAASRLQTLASDTNTPAIVRATALNEISQGLHPMKVSILSKILLADDALIRVAALRTLSLASPQDQVTLGWPLLNDPVRAVRVEAARVLSPMLQQRLPASHRQYLLDRVTEYEQTQRTNAERPESHINLGLVAMAAGDLSKAEAAYRKALFLQKDFVPAWINLADLMRATARENESEAILQQGIAIVPGSQDLHYALGLLYVRTHRNSEALQHLKVASELAVGNPHFLYVYALLLESAGERNKAVKLLNQIRQYSPAAAEISRLEKNP